MAVYFLQSQKVGSYIRMRLLPNQFDDNGELMDISLNVRCDKAKRDRYPVGTVFATYRVEFAATSTRITYYLAGNIFPVSIDDKTLLEQYFDACPSPRMREAYELYKQNNNPAIVVPMMNGAEVKTSDKEQKQEEVQPNIPNRSFLEAIQADKSLAVPTISKDGFFVNERDWYLLVRNIQKNVNTMLVGQTGTGKSELIRLACKKMNLPCRVYDMGSMHDPLSQLLGVHRLQNGQSVFEYARFAEDVQQPGVIVLDELSRAPLGTANILFSCLDSQRTLHIEMAGGEGLRSIPIHPQCTFIATANVGAEYTGTFSMDRALISRFFPLEFGYLDKANEIRLLMNRIGISRDDADNIVSVADTVRNLYKNQDISCTVSTRETLSAASLVADGWSAMDALELTFLPLFEGSKDEGERSIISKIFLTR